MSHLFSFEFKNMPLSRSLFKKNCIRATGLILLGTLLITTSYVSASESEALGDEIESSAEKIQKPEIISGQDSSQKKLTQDESTTTKPLKADESEQSDSSEIEISQEPMAETLTPPTTVPDHNVIEEEPIVNVQTNIDQNKSPKTQNATTQQTSQTNDENSRSENKNVNTQAESKNSNTSDSTKNTVTPEAQSDENSVKATNAPPLNELPESLVGHKSEPTAPVTTDAPALEDSAPALQPKKKIKVQKAKPLTLLGTEIPPGMATRVAWRPGHTLKGLASQAPVLVVHGSEPGPTMCVTGAVHGDELNGIEVVRQVLHKVKASKLKGTLIGVPIVNIQGFLRNSRYLVDRRDLNRYFPGTEHGSLASRIAHSFFHKVILNCSALVDVHTGSFYRDNIPQLRADLRIPGVVEMTKGFGSTLVLQSGGAEGTLRRAAVEHNIPAVTLELGGPMILDADAVEHGAEGIMNLLDALGMYKKNSFWGTPKPVYHQSLWVRAEHGGIFFSKVKLGDMIKPGDLLGTITNPITNEQYLLVSPYTGEVVGLADNQVVYPGFATTHLAFRTDQNLNIKGLSDHLEKD